MAANRGTTCPQLSGETLDNLETIADTLRLFRELTLQFLAADSTIHGLLLAYNQLLTKLKKARNNLPEARQKVKDVAIKKIKKYFRFALDNDFVCAAWGNPPLRSPSPFTDRTCLYTVLDPSYRGHGLQRMLKESYGGDEDCRYDDVISVRLVVEVCFFG